MRLGRAGERVCKGQRLCKGQKVRGTRSVYAAVAADNPYGLVALRMRGVKYIWAGISLLQKALSS